MFQQLGKPPESELGMWNSVSRNSGASKEIPPSFMVPNVARLAVFFTAIIISGGGLKAAPKDDLAARCFAEKDPGVAIDACSAAITAGQSDAAHLAKAYVSRGNAYFIKGDYDAAIRDYNEAVTIHPTYPIAFNNLGNVYSSSGNYSRAITDYTQAIRLNPKYAAAFNNRCAAYNDTGQYDLAIEDCNEAIRLDPTRSNYFVGRGNAYSNKKAYDQAIQDFGQAIQIDQNNVSAFKGRCTSFLKKLEYREAIKNCDQAI